MRKAVTVGKKELLSLGTRVGKFTKTRKFKIQITFLDYLAQYALVGVIMSTISSKRSGAHAGDYTVQSLDQAIFRNVFPLWKQRA